MKTYLKGINVEVNEVEGDIVSLIVDVDASNFIEEGYYSHATNPDSKEVFMSVERQLRELPENEVIGRIIEYAVSVYNDNEKRERKYNALICQAKERIKVISKLPFYEKFSVLRDADVNRYWELIGWLQKRKFKH